jgi:hypothetical protein
LEVSSRDVDFAPNKLITGLLAGLHFIWLIFFPDIGTGLGILEERGDSALFVSGDFASVGFSRGDRRS